MKGKTILITGGTGSLGQALVNYALSLGLRRIIVFSRNEFDQFEMEQRLPPDRFSVSYILGDVRNLDSLMLAFKDVDYVIHTAALKHVRKCEENPEEAIETNVTGARNVIRAAIERKVKKVLAVSSDKAVNPINLYGATKLAADKLFIAGNRYGQTIFSVIRPGNFVDSRGSVIPLFRRLKQDGAKFLPIHDKRMTRYWITLEKAGELCFRALEESTCGFIFSPKMPSYKIVDMAMHICPGIELVEVGAEPGEKIHEDLILASDGVTLNNKCFYITLPPGQKAPAGSKIVTQNINSEENDQWIIELS